MQIKNIRISERSVTINALEHVFPIVGGSIKKTPFENQLVIKQIYGTAFSIGDKCFLTAAHVVESAKENEWAGIGYPEGQSWKVSSLIDSETITESDLGIVKADVPNPKSLKWRFDQLSMLEDVQTVGYPYSLDLENLIIGARAFTGHIVAGPIFQRLTAKPRIYELSFQCPRGLSGAPLLRKNSIVGMIIGNRTTQMLVFSDKEILAEGGKETIVERYESLQLGMALQSASVININSRILGTIRNHLVNNGLV